MSSGDLGPDLERLPGVLAATVFGDGPTGPRIYLATDGRADRDALHGAVLAILADRGLSADPDRIHIASPPHRETASGSLHRFTLDALDVHRTEGRAECTVRLRTAGRSTGGAATEPDTSAGRARAAARAILAAVESLDPDFRLGLHGTRTLDLFGHETLLVLVEATSGRTHAHLPGAALVERSVEEAAALATLMALRSWRP